METFIGLIVLLGLVALILPIVLGVTNASRVKALEAAIKKVNERIAALEAGKSVETVAKENQPVPVTPVAPVTRSMPPPLPESAAKPPPVVAAAPSPGLTSPPPAVPRPAKPAPAAIDWEAFMGVKLFAWIGGFVLFLGVVFLVKYSFEKNLITPRMRIAIGALIGLSLIGAGWRAATKSYRVPGQSLCATGILVLYADIFGAEAFYNLISLTPAFALMSCVTIAAFFLAVLLDAQVVVILGLLGGFLTPILLSTGPDNPLGLFGYIALLNIGIGAVVLRKRWDHLLLLAAIGTVLMEFAWVGHFFASAKAITAITVFLGFQLQFLLIFFLRRKNATHPKWSAWAAALCGFAALLFAAWILSDYHGLARRPALAPRICFRRRSRIDRTRDRFWFLLFRGDRRHRSLRSARVVDSRVSRCVAFVVGAWQLRRVCGSARRLLHLTENNRGAKNTVAIAESCSAAAAGLDLVVRLARTGLRGGLACCFPHQHRCADSRVANCVVASRSHRARRHTHRGRPLDRIRFRPD